MSATTPKTVLPGPYVPEKLGAACGDYSLRIIWQTLMFFLPIFYTDTFGLSPVFIAGLFLWVRVIDAVTDPLCGILCDRTRTRWGKYRPYLLWFSIPYGVSIFLMFTTPDFDPAGKQVYAAVTYTLVMLLFTVTATPNNCLTAVISDDHETRTSVSSYKFVFAYAAGFTVQLLIVPLVQKLGAGDSATGYRLSMGIFAVISIIGLLITFATVRERVPPPEGKASVRQDLLDLRHNRPWLIVFGLALVALIYIAIRSASVAYYFKYVLDREAQMGVFMSVGTAFVLIGVLPSTYLARRFGKVKVMQVCMGIVLLSLVGFYFPGPDDMVALYALQIVFSLASGPMFPLIWSMLADTADYSEWKTGRRADGLVFSAGTFATKMGFAVGGMFVMIVLGWFGFVANEAQSESSLTGIRLSMSLIPAAVVLVGMVGFARYPLTNAKLTTMAADLRARRAAATE